jgi:hypothetical protein
MSKPLIMLTGTIKSDLESNLLRNNPEQRLDDYFKSLSYYSRMSEKLGFDVIFLENSGADMSKLALPNIILRRAPGRTDPLKGKGSGEADLIDFGVTSDPTISSRPWIAKITGRLILANMEKIFLKIPTEQNFFMARVKSDLTSLDSRLLIFDPKVWGSYFLRMGSDVSDDSGLFLESIAMQRLLGAMNGGVTFSPFIRSPRYKGYSGTSNQKYHTWKFRLNNLLEDAPIIIKEKFLNQ